MKRLNLLLNAAVIAFFLYYLTYHVGWSALGAYFVQGSAWEVGMVTCFATFTIALGAVRLHFLLQPLVAVPYRRLLACQMVAAAVSYFTPGQLGAPVSLSLLLRRDGVSLKASAFVFFADKAVMLLVTAGLASLGLYRFFDAYGMELSLGARAGMALGAAVLAGAAVALHPGLRAYVLEKLRYIAEKYRSAKRVIALNFLLALVNLTITAVVWYLLFHGHAVRVSLLDLVVLMPIVSMIVYLPISINGIGVQDMGAIFLLRPLGVPPEAVVYNFTVVRISLVLVCFAILLLRNRLIGGPIPAGEGGDGPESRT